MYYISNDNYSSIIQYLAVYHGDWISVGHTFKAGKVQIPHVGGVSNPTLVRLCFCQSDICVFLYFTFGTPCCILIVTMWVYNADMKQKLRNESNAILLLYWKKQCLFEFFYCKFIWDLLRWCKSLQLFLAYSIPLTKSRKRTQRHFTLSFSMTSWALRNSITAEFVWKTSDWP